MSGVASGASALLTFWMSSLEATTRGFDLVAWIAPLAVFAAALLGTILLVRRWSAGKGRTETPVSDPAMDALKEKIRRETGSNGGF